MSKDFERFLDFCRMYHTEYVLECQQNKSQPKVFEDYINSYFNFLVDQFKNRVLH
tara:strand:+ start:148 stop:312 length:165 start_codon:yes stop_codon:yes gene_type:complete